MTASARAVSAIALVPLLSACLNLFPRPIEDVHRRGSPSTPTEIPVHRNGADSAFTLGLSRKPVSGKEEPATLLARDGSRCIVTEKRFKEVALGEQVTCAWK